MKEDLQMQQQLANALIYFRSSTQASARLYRILRRLFFLSLKIKPS